MSAFLLSGRTLAVLREDLRRDASELLFQTSGLLLKPAQFKPAVECLLPFAPDVRIELLVFLFQRFVLIRDGDECLRILLQLRLHLAEARQQLTD